MAGGFTAAVWAVAVTNWMHSVLSYSTRLLHTWIVLEQHRHEITLCMFEFCDVWDAACCALMLCVRHGRLQHSHPCCLCYTAGSPSKQAIESQLLSLRRELSTEYRKRLEQLELEMGQRAQERTAQQEAAHALEIQKARKGTRSGWDWQRAQGAKRAGTA
jgi:hypothetical protein